MSQEKTKSKLFPLLAGFIALAAIIVILYSVYSKFSTKPVIGSKAITIEVVNDDGETTLYNSNTDAEYLRQAMDELTEHGFSYSGTESEYGIMTDTVNGLKADFNKDGAYWSFYVNGEYCNYGIDNQPISNGDAFKIEYTTE